MQFLLLLLVYIKRPDNINSFLSKLEVVFSILYTRFENLILVGDINIGVLNKDNIYRKFVCVII